jgi:hypothetical protein
MPTITVSDATFAELKSIAEPFVDTPESLMATLIHAEVERRRTALNGNGQVPSSGENKRRLDPDSHENLKHTRVISATVDGQPLHRPKWNSLHEHLHRVAHGRVGSFEALVESSDANLRQGRFEENGYKYVPDLDLSIQGVDSNLAWNHSLLLARSMNVPITVTVEWRNKDGAAYPGEQGVLQWNPELSLAT